MALVDDLLEQQQGKARNDILSRWLATKTHQERAEAEEALAHPAVMHATIEALMASEGFHTHTTTIGALRRKHYGWKRT